jgi:hypothetical protein
MRVCRGSSRPLYLPTGNIIRNSKELSSMFVAVSSKALLVKKVNENSNLAALFTSGATFHPTAVVPACRVSI